MSSEMYYTTLGIFFFALYIFIWKILASARLFKFQEHLFIYFNFIKSAHKIPYCMPDVFERYKKIGFFKMNTILKNFVFVYRPELIQKLLSDDEIVIKPILDSVVRGILDDTLMFRNGDKWRTRKSLLMPCFLLKNFNKYIPRVEEYSIKVVEKLNSTTKSDWINFNEICYGTFIKISSEYLFGISNKINEYSSDYILNVMKDIKTEIFYEIIRKITHTDMLFKLTANGRKFMKINSFVKRIVEEAVKKRSQQIQEHESDCFKFEITEPLADRLLKELGSNPDINIENITQECMTLLTVGDGPSLSSILALNEIGKNPVVQEKIQKELDSIFEDKDRRINTEDLARMEYLECVIKEILRLYPFIPFTLRDAQKDIQLGNEKFSKDCIYIISFFRLHRNSEIFSNPDVFDPDRFLPENCNNRHHYAFLPFSRGARQCVGYRFAMIEIKVFLATLLRRLAVESFPKEVSVKMNGVSLETTEPVFMKTHPR